MNFLSHLHLSGNDEELMLGNFMADSVKGKELFNYSEEVQKGIVLHRKIDAFTDSHAVVEKSKARLRSNYRKYAPVIVDIFYDHFLAVNWENYHNSSLPEYADEVYSLMKQHEGALPQRTAMFVQYMIKYDVLNAYAKIEGVEQVLKGMDGRAKFNSNMALSVRELRQHYHHFEDEFNTYYPLLESYVAGEVG